LEVIQAQQAEEHSSRSTHAPIRKLSGLPKGAKLLSARTDESSKFWDYLVNRGLTEREILGVRAHYIPSASCVVYDTKNRRRGDVGNRLVFPIYGGDNSLVSWQARVVDPNYQGHDKYLTAPESELTKTVWPYVKPHGTSAVITEGILDALAVRRLPQVSAYSTFSKKISLEQMLLLKSWGILEITVFWDKRDALKEIVKAIPDLQMHFKKVYVCRMTNWPAEKDPGNMLAEIQGSDTIMEALNDRVDTYDSLEFARWQLAWTA
jgi:DNA primase